MVRGEGKLGCDLLEWILGVGKAELVTKKVCFRRASIGGGCGPGDVESGLDELLGLLHQAGDVEHGW